MNIKIEGLFFVYLFSQFTEKLKTVYKCQSFKIALRYAQH